MFNRFLSHVKKMRAWLSGSNIIIHRSVYFAPGLNVVLGDFVRIPAGCRLAGDVSIGRGTGLGEDCRLKGEVSIGKYCEVGRGVLFQGLHHSLEYPCLNISFYRRVFGVDMEVVSKKINVGNDVWIGSNAIILASEIGDGAVIGAGAIVTKDVDPYSVVAGVPARHKKWRFSVEARKKLVGLRWWDWSEDQIKRNKEFFMEAIY